MNALTIQQIGSLARRANRVKPGNCGACGGVDLAGASGGGLVEPAVEALDRQEAEKLLRRWEGRG